MSRPADWLTAARTVAAKELLTSFRDRQMRVYTLLLPLVMYPAMFWVALQAMTLVEGLRQARVVTVEVVPGPGAKARAAELERALAERALDEARTALPVGAGAPQGPTEPATRFALTAPAAGPDALGERVGDRVEAVLWVPRDGPLELVHDGSRAGSRVALERVEELVAALVLAERERMLAAPVESLRPYDFRSRDVAAPEQLGAFVLSTMLPIMLVAMATMGAFFPAVDVTAGEKERRTAETTLLLPVPRAAVLAGQLTSVSVASLAATAMNLVGMTLAANHLLGMLTENVAFSLPIAKVLVMLPVVLSFSVLLSAALTAAASFTETFKQGQALLGTVQTVFILPAVASTLPGITLTHGVAAIPVVGTSVALREVLRADGLAAVPWGPLATNLVTTGLVAVASVWLAVRALEREGGPVPRWVRALTGGGRP